MHQPWCWNRLIPCYKPHVCRANPTLLPLLHSLQLLLLCTIHLCSKRDNSLLVSCCRELHCVTFVTTHYDMCLKPKLVLVAGRSLCGESQCIPKGTEASVSQGSTSCSSISTRYYPNVTQYTPVPPQYHCNTTPTCPNATPIAISTTPVPSQYICNDQRLTLHCEPCCMASVVRGVG